jgi:accessory gene regulator protein AgrB
MKDLFGELLKSFLDNVGYLFGIDFLSFFVSGATCLGAFAFAWWQFHLDTFPKQLTDGLSIAAIAIACYVLGMVCFASGRWIRTKLFRNNSNNLLYHILEGYAQVGEEPFPEYCKKAANMGLKERNHLMQRLYSLMWTEIRQSQQLMASYTLLNRYWFMGATYDGLGMASIVWFLVVFSWGLKIGIQHHPLLGIFIIVLVLLPFICWREADRYKQYQVEELVATLTYQRNRYYVREE